MWSNEAVMATQVSACLNLTHVVDSIKSAEVKLAPGQMGNGWPHSNNALTYWNNKRKGLEPVAKANSTPSDKAETLQTSYQSVWRSHLVMCLLQPSRRVSFNVCGRKFLLVSHLIRQADCWASVCVCVCHKHKHGGSHPLLSAQDKHPHCWYTKTTYALWTLNPTSFACNNWKQKSLSRQDKTTLQILNTAGPLLLLGGLRVLRSLNWFIWMLKCLESKSWHKHSQGYVNNLSSSSLQPRFLSNNLSAKGKSTSHFWKGLLCCTDIWVLLTLYTMSWVWQRGKFRLFSQ